MSFLRSCIHRFPWLVQGYHYCWAFVSAVFYYFPSRRLYVIGVTGTKGKSTVVALLHHIFMEAGYSSAMISSVEIVIDKKHFLKPADNTMPGRFYIQRFLYRALKQGCKFAIIEVTSEGVLLHRHRCINWSAAVFLNLHPEHIERHGSFEQYRDAKVSFFRYAARHKNSLFIINKDDTNKKYFIDVAREGKVIQFGASDLPSQLAGEFNMYNIGSAVAIAQSLGISHDIIRKAVHSFEGVPGRMECIKGKGYDVVVDYAHTPDSLQCVYKTLRPRARRLICVLGSAGGGRDVWKRAESGKIADQYCDEIIVTNEDPYDESPEEILEHIISGFSKSQISNPNFFKILDRKKAIKKALSLAESGDVVIITGKGSESIIHEARGRMRSHSDIEVVRELLSFKG